MMNAERPFLLGLTRTDVSRVDLRAHATSIAILGQGESSQYTGIRQILLAEFDQAVVGTPGVRSNLLNGIFPTFSIHLAEGAIRVVFDLWQEFRKAVSHYGP